MGVAATPPEEVLSGASAVVALNCRSSPMAFATPTRRTLALDRAKLAQRGLAEATRAATEVCFIIIVRVLCVLNECDLLLQRDGWTTDGRGNRGVEKKKPAQSQKPPSKPRSDRLNEP